MLRAHLIKQISLLKDLLSKGLLICKFVLGISSEEDLVFDDVFLNFLTIDYPLLFHGEFNKTSVQWESLWKTLTLRNLIQSTPRAKMKTFSHSQELRGYLQHPLFSSRCAWNLIPILRSPWFCEMKAWTPGLLNSMHLTWAELEHTIPPMNIWVLLKYIPTTQNV